MLGTGNYGVPVGMKIVHSGCRSDGWKWGDLICTSRDLTNWYCYPLVSPAGVDEPPQITCLKVLAPLMVAPDLQSIAAFNEGADPWNQKLDNPRIGNLCITFLPDDDLIHFSAVRAQQALLRQELIIQEEKEGRIVIFIGNVDDIPVKQHAFSVPKPEYAHQFQADDAFVPV